MLIFKVAIIQHSKRIFLNLIQYFLNQNGGRGEQIALWAHKPSLSHTPDIEPKEEKLLIPYNLALSVQSGGHSVLLDKCTRVSASTVYSIEKLKVPWTAQIHLTLPQFFPS